MPIGEEFKVNFHAVRTPPGWLAEWSSAAVGFPALAVLGTARDEGAIAVDVRNDMIVRPAKLGQLTPLAAAEKAKYGLAGVPTTLAYRYENRKYAASLAVDRARTASERADIFLPSRRPRHPRLPLRVDLHG